MTNSTKGQRVTAESQYHVLVTTGREGEQKLLPADTWYDASALMNHYADQGFHVDADPWENVIPDAMLTPKMAAQVAQTKLW